MYRSRHAPGCRRDRLRIDAFAYRSCCCALGTQNECPCISDCYVIADTQLADVADCLVDDYIDERAVLLAHGQRIVANIDLLDRRVSLGRGGA